MPQQQSDSNDDGRVTPAPHPHAQALEVADATGPSETRRSASAPPAGAGHDGPAVDMPKCLSGVAVGGAPVPSQPMIKVRDDPRQARFAPRSAGPSWVMQSRCDTGGAGGSGVPA